MGQYRRQTSIEALLEAVWRQVTFGGRWYRGVVEDTLERLRAALR